MCIFCLEANNPMLAKAFLGDSWPYESRVLFSNDHMYAVPGYGPEVFPYVLIISRRHFSSLSGASPLERAAIFDTIDGLRQIGVVSSGRVCVFEHGGCGPSQTQSCIDHFHLHLIDPVFDLCSFLEQDYEVERAIVTRDQGLCARGRYLFTGIIDSEDTMNGVVAHPVETERQYFRKKISEVTGQSIWDWHCGMNPNLMLDVMRLAITSPGPRVRCGSFPTGE